MKAKIGKWSKSNRRNVDIVIESHDSWNVDSTLALIILPMLIQLKANKVGVPGILVDDVGGEDYLPQQSFDFYSETHKESWDKAAKRWDEILDKMIWSFQQIALEDYHDKYHHGNPTYEWVETEETIFNTVTNKTEKLYQMIDKNPDQHWYDGIGDRLHDERIQEGLELFGKYYRALWD